MSRFGAGKLWSTSENVDEVETWNAYTPPPPVTIEQGVPEAEGPSWWQGFLEKGMTNTFGPKSPLVNIFGQQVRPEGAPPPAAPQPGVPTWIWLAIPVAVVGVVVLARRRKAPSVAGYRRRRRSRR